jgi:phosphoribosylaminoimidazolecarboxamide formyltransferase/IMP cyclohydrolase
LISVFDKTGIVAFASTLSELGYELVSTGGSADTLAKAGLPVTTVESVTGFPEILDGRVKTLHPTIHGGLLARIDVPAHLAALDKHGIVPIELLVSNLYPFERAVADPGLDDQAKIEQIDIGGPAMVRAAAKNHGSVIVVTDPADYDGVTAMLNDGAVTATERRRLAAKAFGHVSTYDALVAGFLRAEDPPFPEELAIPLRHAAAPRYGENPQQPAAAYARLSADGTAPGLLDANQIAGEPLSFNNYLDGDAAWQACQMFQEPAVAIVKHMVPCGLAVRESLAAAYESAFAGDPVSAFGGIVALNRIVDRDTAALMRKIKLDIIIAPGYDDEAREILLRKKGTRILVLPNRDRSIARTADLDVRPIAGGLLVQTPDLQPDDPGTWKVVTDKAPTPAQMADLTFAWNAARLVKSNAIVFARENAIVGLGAGQPNRLESVAIAARKAQESAHGAAMASDAFFPFADGIEQAIAAGITSVIQPGGSLRDQEVIDAANAAGIAMVFTGTRHFRH